MNPKAKQSLMNWLLQNVGTNHFTMRVYVGIHKTPGITLCLAGTAAAFAYCDGDLDQVTNLVNTNNPSQFDSRIFAIQRQASKYLGISDYCIYNLCYWPPFYQGIYKASVVAINALHEVVKANNFPGNYDIDSFTQPLAGYLLLQDAPENEDGSVGFNHHLKLASDDYINYFKKNLNVLHKFVSQYQINTNKVNQ